MTRPWVMILVLLSASLGSCGPPPTPRQTAEGYLAALSQLDFDAASRYVSAEGRQNFEVLRQLYAGLGPEEQKKFVVTDWAVTNESITGDSATVAFTFDGTKRGLLSLQRISGVWKVDHRRTF